MIQCVITHRCTKCNSMNIVKNGTDYKGKQKFHCLDCDAYGTLEPQSRSYPEFVKEFVLRAYRERATRSVRGVERIFGIARQTLARWIIEKVAALPDLADTLETAKADDVLELDELWSFVFRKSDKRWILSRAGRKCTIDVHQEYATDVHQKCARHVHQECATYVHRKCTADVRPKCTTCPGVQSLPRGLPGQALEQDGKRDSVAESTRQDQSRRSLGLSQ